MNKLLLSILCLSMLLTLTCPGNAFSTDHSIQKEIGQLYRKGEYRRVLDLLEKRINAPTPPDTGTGGNGAQRYQDLLFSSYIRAWRLNDTDGALADLKRAADYRTRITSRRDFPPVELLFAGELYERKGDRAEAERRYRELLDALNHNAKTDLDNDSRLLLGELARLVRYQIDGLNRAAGRKETLLMPVFPKVDTTSAVAVSYLSIFVSPMAQYEPLVAGKYDPVDLISKATNDLGSGIFTFALVAESPAGAAYSPQEKAADAYLAKYGDGYCALMLRILLIRNYKENGESAKAAAMTEAVRHIAAGRGIQVVLGQDPRFSSPEKTWETFLAALRDGDTDTLVSCFSPDERMYAEGWSVLSREQIAALLNGLGELKRISGTTKEASYLLQRKVQGKEAGSEVRFRNVDGEWKMDSI